MSIRCTYRFNTKESPYKRGLYLNSYPEYKFDDPRIKKHMGLGDNVTIPYVV